MTRCLGRGRPGAPLAVRMLAGLSPYFLPMDARKFAAQQRVSVSAAKNYYGAGHLDAGKHHGKGLFYPCGLRYIIEPEHLQQWQIQFPLPEDHRKELLRRMLSKALEAYKTILRTAEKGV